MPCRFSIFILCIAAAAAASAATSDPVPCSASWACDSFSRVPQACALERCLPRRLEKYSSKQLIDEELLARLSFDRGEQVLDSALLSHASDLGASEALHILRGKFRVARGVLGDALCDFQAALALGNADAGDLALDTVHQLQVAEDQRFRGMTTDKIRLAQAAELVRGIRSQLAVFTAGEWRYSHVHHTTAIEGNPLSASAARVILESHVAPSGACWSQWWRLWEQMRHFGML